MNKPNYRNIFSGFLPFISFILILLGGFDKNPLSFNFISFLLLLSVIFSKYFLSERIRFPPTFRLYLIFILFFLLSLVWSKNTLTSASYLFLFASGGLVWLVFYNSKISSEFTDRLVVLTGILFGAIYIFNNLRGNLHVSEFNLVNYSVYSKDHHHIGDLWSVITGLLIFRLVKRKPPVILTFAACLAGLYFLLISDSRSAYISLSAGLLYLISSLPQISKNSKLLIYSALALSIILFIWISGYKGLLLHRQSYFIGVIGFLRNPLGVGVGNFSFITKDPANHIFGLSAYSGVADNIFLEILTGMGLFGFIFVYWTFNLFRNIKKIESPPAISNKLILLILSVNFLFNYIYFIPTILWVWFMILGNLQSTSHLSEHSN